jgi:hypothetical protein
VAVQQLARLSALQITHSRREAQRAERGAQEAGDRQEATGNSKNKTPRLQREEPWQSSRPRA